MADNSRLVSEEELRKELAKLSSQFEPGKWSGTVEDVFQAYAGLAEVHVRNFPGELKLAMADYDKGQFDAKTREIVNGLSKHMKGQKPERQWGSQQAINHAKTSAARDLIEDPGYRQQRSDFQESLTRVHEKHLDMIYEAEKQTLQVLGLDPDHSPDGPKQSQRVQTNLDLAEQYSDYKVNLEAYSQAQADLEAQVTSEQGREVPEIAKTDIEIISEQLEKYKQSLRDRKFDKREHDLALTPGAYLAADHFELQKRLNDGLTEDLKKLEVVGAMESKGFGELIRKLDEAIREKEIQSFEATGQPGPDVRKENEAARLLLYWNADQTFHKEHSSLQKEREEALRAQCADNAQKLEHAYQELRQPPEIEKALQDAKAQIEDIKRRQAERSVSASIKHILANDEAQPSIPASLDDTAAKPLPWQTQVSEPVSHGPTQGRPLKPSF